MKGQSCKLLYAMSIMRREERLSMHPLLVFLLKGAKETGTVFRFGLPSRWLSKLEVIEICATSEYANIGPPEIGGRKKSM